MAHPSGSKWQLKKQPEHHGAVRNAAAEVHLILQLLLQQLKIST
jgi:hypothetical protein